MVRIVQCRDRHFIDDRGRLFWINGPEEHCYLSEQRQWRRGLSFDQVLLWKQCAPSGVVSQRFGSVAQACEAFEHGLIQWSQDLYLRRMGDQMALHRGADDYVPTAIQKEDAARGLPPRRPPWSLPEPAGPCCGLPPRAGLASGMEMAHPHRRRRSSPAAH
ncbi:MAG: hypothetical protein ACK5E6_09685 [Cyanobacteriota bacterium]|jgi:hypothetical protein